MNKILFGLIIMGLMSIKVHAEPILIEPTVEKREHTSFKISIGFDYALEQRDELGTEKLSDYSSLLVPVGLQLGLPGINIDWLFPYQQFEAEVEDEERISGKVEAMPWFGAGIKANIITNDTLALAGGLSTRFTTVDQEAYLFNEGVSIKPHLSADLFVEKLTLHTMVGYEYRSSYMINWTYNPIAEKEIGDQMRVKPGNAIHFGIGAEYQIISELALLLEFVGAHYADVVLGDSEDILVTDMTWPESGGMTLAIVPGVSFSTGNIKINCGVSYPLDSKENRPSYAPHHDLRLIANASYQFGL